MTDSLMAGWDNFYVMIGSAAAALTGLTFVVIALAADGHRVTPRGLRAFVSPTIVHFGTVLVVAAYLCVPRHGATSLSCGFAAVGVAGLVYSGITGASMRQTGIAYVPVFEDWLWHVILPIFIYGAVFAMAILIRYRPGEALYGVAAALMLLLFIGIHNAWDVAASISLRKQPDSPSQQEDSP
jgi:hypothetical protein